MAHTTSARAVPPRHPPSPLPSAQLPNIFIFYGNFLFNFLLFLDFSRVFFFFFF